MNRVGKGRARQGLVPERGVTSGHLDEGPGPGRIPACEGGTGCRLGRRPGADEHLEGLGRHDAGHGDRVGPDEAKADLGDHVGGRPDRHLDVADEAAAEPVLWRWRSSQARLGSATTAAGSAAR